MKRICLFLIVLIFLIGCASVPSEPIIQSPVVTGTATSFEEAVEEVYEIVAANFFYSLNNSTLD